MFRAECWLTWCTEPRTHPPWSGGGAGRCHGCRARPPGSPHGSNISQPLIKGKIHYLRSFLLKMEINLERNLSWILHACKIILTKNHEDVFVNNAAATKKITSIYLYFRPSTLPKAVGCCKDKSVRNERASTPENSKNFIFHS